MKIFLWYSKAALSITLIKILLWYKNCIIHNIDIMLWYDEAVCMCNYVIGTKTIMILDGRKHCIQHEIR